MIDLLDLFARITLDTSGYEQGLNNAASSANTLGGKIKSALAGIAKVSTAAIGAAASGVAALTKSAVENYKNYEQLVGGVETLFKDSADTVQQYAANAFQTAGLSANEYMETVTSFSASLLQSLDGDTAAAAEVADKAITDMSDNANKMGTDMQMIQNAYQGFAKQNYTTLDNLKLGYGGTKEEMQRLLEDAEKFSGIKYDLSSYADIVEAIHVIQTEMGITGTTAAEAAITIEGSVNAMSSAWQNLVTGIANENADFETLIDNFVDSAATAMDNLLPRIKTSLNGIGKLVTEISPIIAEAIPELVDDVLPSIIQAAVDLVNTLINALAENGGMIANTALDVLDMLVNALDENAYVITNGAIVIITTLANGILNRLPELIPIAADIVLQLVNALTDNLSPLITAGETVFMSLVDGLPKIINGIISVITEIIDSIVDALLTAVPQLIDAGITVFTSLVTELPTIITEITAAVPEIITALTDAFVKFLPDIVNTGVELLSSLVDDLPQIITEIVDVLPEIIDSIVDALLTAVPQLIDAGITVFTSIVTELPMIIQGIISAVPEIITAITDTFADFLPIIVNAGVELFTSLVDDLPQIITTIVDVLPKIIDNIVDELMNALPQLINAGITLFTSIVTELPTIIDGIISAVPKIITALTDEFEDFIPNMLDAGKNLIAGIGNGLIDGLSNVKEKIKEAGNTILNSFKDFFGIASPSKLFKNEIGKYLAEGLGIGFTDQMASVAADMAKAVPTDFETEIHVDINSDAAASTTKTEDLIVAAAKKTGEKQKSVLEQNMEALERAYKQRKLTEEQYQKERLDYLEKHRDEESDEWTKYYDSVQTYYEKAAETEKKAAEKAAKEQQKAAEKAAQERKKNFKTILDAYNKQVEQLQKKISALADKLTGSYKDFYNFETDEEGNITDAYASDKITQAGDRLQKYYDELVKFQGRGVGSDMISQLSDFSQEEGLATLEYWNSLTDEEIKNLQAKYDRVTELSNKVGELIYSDEAKSTAEAFADKISDAVENDEQFRAIGELMLSGIIDGLNSGTFDITEAANRIYGAFNGYFQSGAVSSGGSAAVPSYTAPATTFTVADTNVATPAKKSSETLIQGENEIGITITINIEEFNNYTNEDIDVLADCNLTSKTQKNDKQNTKNPLEIANNRQNKGDFYNQIK